MNNIWQEIKTAFYIIRINIISATQLKGAFLTQCVGMMLNDIAFVYIWNLFFQIVGTVNGWGAIEMIGIQGLHVTAYGIVMGLFYGSHNLPELINNGALDNYLISPKSLYMRIITNNIEVSAIGDLFFGLILFIFFAIYTQITLLQLFLVILILPASVIIFMNIALTLSLVGFFLPDAMDLNKNLMDLYITPGFFPYNLYTGLTKFIFLFVFPALMIGGFPLEIVKDQYWVGVVIIWALAILWTTISTRGLKYALHRYESGNLVGARAF